VRVRVCVLRVSDRGIQIEGQHTCVVPLSGSLDRSSHTEHDSVCVRVCVSVCLCLYVSVYVCAGVCVCVSV